MENGDFKNSDYNFTNDFLQNITYFGGRNVVVAGIKYLILAFIFVHLFGLFGIFIALCYPLAWFFLPSRILCFYCLHQRYTKKRTAGYCEVCQREVHTIYDISFKSMVVNMVTIALLSIVFLGIVLLELNILTHLKLPTSLFATNSASISINSSDVSTYKVNEPQYFDIVINSPTQSINLVKTDLAFDNEMIEVSDVETLKSFANIFVSKDFSNKDGKISIVGGLASPGYIGENGLFVRIYFTPKKPGAVEIKTLDTSRILANDGKGTNIMNEFVSYKFVVE